MSIYQFEHKYDRVFKQVDSYSRTLDLGTRCWIKDDSEYDVVCALNETKILGHYTDLLARGQMDISRVESEIRKIESQNKLQKSLERLRKKS